ncbi:MAG: thiamine-phosphate kinase [bacterium]
MSSTQMPGEFQLIQRLQTILASAAQNADGRQVVAGIGDDCAVLRGARGKYLLVTTDMLIEDVHFSRDYSSLREIGQKAMIVNLSDIAAMGGEPKYAFISVALPASFYLEEFDELWHGLAAVAREYSVLILGGDTNASFPQVEERGLVINITLIGEVCPQGLITRHGARPGDLILLTGQIGDSAAGLDLLQAIEHPSFQEDSPSLQASYYLLDSQYQKALQRHRVPVVRLAESRIISQHRLATAMIDVSDGVAGDLRHLCRHVHQGCHEQQALYGPSGRQGSRVSQKCGPGEAGALLWLERLPISGAVIEIAKVLQKPVLSYALFGGEDYELLFTSPPDLAEKARQMIEQATGTRVSIIGEITEKIKGVRLIDAQGQAIPVPESGFDHFRKAKRGE